MMLGGGGGGNQGLKMDGVVTNEWKDIPEELLWRILSLVKDDRTVIVAAGVCCGWRDAICLGLNQLSLSWYALLFSLFCAGIYIYYGDMWSSFLGILYHYCSLLSNVFCFILHGI